MSSLLNVDANKECTTVETNLDPLIAKSKHFVAVSMIQYIVFHHSVGAVHLD